MGNFNSIIVSVAILAGILGLDIIYRKFAKVRIELYTVEIIIFSCVHTIYQLIGITVLGHASVWSTNIIPVIKSLCLLTLLMGAIAYYRTLQVLLDQSIRSYIKGILKTLEGTLSQDQKNQIDYLEQIAQKVIGVSLWEKSSLGGDKQKVRELMAGLLNSIGVRSELCIEDGFLIEDSKRENFRKWTRVFALISLFIAIWPM